MSKNSKKKIVRCNGSGVWFGEVASKYGDTAVLKNAISRQLKGSMAGRLYPHLNRKEVMRNEYI